MSIAVGKLLQSSVITREHLHNIKELIDEETLVKETERVVKDFKQCVIQAASNGKTSFVYPSSRVSHVTVPYPKQVLERAISHLDNVFPDSEITYVESKNIHGYVTEMGIRIDWS